jgi:hypothetical protein
MQMKINNCPFCDSDFVGLVQYKELHQITCHVCNAEGPTKSTDRKAANAWNKVGKNIADLEEKEQLLNKLVEKIQLMKDDEDRQAFIARTKQRQKERLQVDSDTKAWTSFDRTNKCNHTFDNPRCPHC